MVIICRIIVNNCGNMSILETHLDSKSKRAILRMMFLEQHRDFSIAELSRELEIDKSLVSKIIIELEKNKVIETSNRGRLKLCKVNKRSELFDPLSSIFGIEDELLNKDRLVRDGYA